MFYTGTGEAGVVKMFRAGQVGVGGGYWIQETLSLHSLNK